MTRPALRLASEELRAAPRQSRSVARREKLLEAGRALFAEKGYEATSIGEIAARAGAASGGFYTYFRSKRQLLVVLMHELLDRLAAVDLTPTSDLRLFLREVFATDLAYFGVIRAWQEATLTDPELARMRAEIEQWTESRILAVFRSLQQSPHARPDRDLETFARMMDRHFWSLLARAATADFGRELDVAADVIQHYLMGDAR